MSILMQGWAPGITPESLLLQVRQLFMEGNVRINNINKKEWYTEEEARAGFNSVKVKTYETILQSDYFSKHTNMTNPSSREIQLELKISTSVAMASTIFPSINPLFIQCKSKLSIQLHATCSVNPQVQRILRKRTGSHFAKSLSS